jgi:hypothetical protein
MTRTGARVQISDKPPEFTLLSLGDDTDSTIPPTGLLRSKPINIERDECARQSLPSNGRYGAGLPGCCLTADWP